MGRSRGFTLPELMIVLALIAGALTVAVPAMNNWLTKSHQHNLANAIAHSITRARTESIKRNGRVTICISSNQQTCTQSGDWAQGWIIFSDIGKSRTLQVGDDIIHYESGDTSHRITATGNRYVTSYLSFISSGKSRQLGGGLQSGTITVCAPGQNATTVTLAATGRVTVAYTKTPCNS